MDNKILTLDQISSLVSAYGYELAMIRSIISTETSGYGFSRLAPYRIIIRFEPTWFEREDKNWRNEKGVWLTPTHANQAAEYAAFNDAFVKNPTAAMLSASIGLGQLMGFHYADCGFKTVGAFWDYCKISEANQLECMLKWIKSEPALDRAVRSLDFYHIAYYYNGEGFEEMAKKNNDTPYDIRLKENRQKFLINA